MSASATAEQLALWQRAPRPGHAPFQASSETSREAAEKIQPRTNHMREIVYQAIVSCGEDGATRKEVEAITGYLTQTACPRLNELERAGRIRKLYRLTGGKAELVKREGCAVYRGMP